MVPNPEQALRTINGSSLIYTGQYEKGNSVSRKNDRVVSSFSEKAARIREDPAIKDEEAGNQATRQMMPR